MHPIKYFYQHKTLSYLTKTVKEICSDGRAMDYHVRGTLVQTQDCCS